MSKSDLLLLQILIVVSGHLKSTSSAEFVPESASMDSVDEFVNLTSSTDDIEIAKPVFKNGVWANPPSMDFKRIGFVKFFKWLSFDRTPPTLPTPEELARVLPNGQPDHSTTSEPDSLQTTWIGHATVLVQMEGVNFLTDPQWSERCSPVSFMGPKRYRPPPIEIEELPKIDFVVISHNHYDHLDLSTVKSLSKRFQPDIHWFVPMGLKSWMESAGCSNVHELNWDESYTLRDNLTIRALPAKHWSKRTALDDFKTLWSSWSVSGPNRRFFFAGDSAFCGEEMDKVGRKYGPFDLAAIPIGCYEPRYIMSGQHMNVDEAVETHNLIRSKNTVGIHWATYPMGCTEHWLAPKERLTELASKLAAGSQFRALNPGFTWRIK